ncbi:uncharacterized protein ACA1_164810 [Acanthamoeba castellanii str. Neff]|uniref:Choice-of-anchor A domain-containing protein n=1 Tax=Acanthamoeba castellanii (strain ATCC 30010 / Neff) TaxID=1257118 RepID=L8GRM4_ACACF|nr:uncharacterized protein ACA1_164810 [Acanthamoeba castellanii str. Neff]ELR15600.1 hypothetical protein ACA1_164810 [Acanthamoeba castellanii str. Neff]
MKTTYLLLALAALLFCAVVAASADDDDRRGSDMNHWDDDDEGHEWDNEWEDEEDGEGRGRGQWDDGREKCRTTTKKCRTTTKKCGTTTKHCPTTTTKRCGTTTKDCGTTTTKSCGTTTKDCGTTTMKPCTTTSKPVEKCDFAGRDNCLKASEDKFEECVDRKKCAFTVCELEAEEKFKKCLRGRDGRDGGRENPFEREGENDRQGNERFDQCKKEQLEDKKQCLIQRKASHAGCVAAKECRDFKCLAFIKDCKPCPTPAATTTTVRVTTHPPTVGSSCPAEDFFGPAADLNVLVTGSDKLIYDLDMVNGDVEGRVAVNGGFRVKSFGTAQAYSCPDTANYASMFNLIVNGKMDYSNGQLFCGSSISLSSMNDPSLRQKDFGATNARVAAGKTIKDVTGFDFVATAGYLQGVSNYFSKYAPGTHSHFRVTEVSPADVNKLNIEGGDYVQVINIKGSGDINFSNFEIPTALNPSQVIYNVVGNNNIKISGFGLKGHLLALNSDVVLENGHVAGNVYVRSLVGQGSGQVNLAPCP